MVYSDAVDLEFGVVEKSLKIQLACERSVLGNLHQPESRHYTHLSCRCNFKPTTNTYFSGVNVLLPVDQVLFLLNLKTFLPLVDIVFDDQWIISVKFRQSRSQLFQM